jgi:DNA-binding NtrC family response regulator
MHKVLIAEDNPNLTKLLKVRLKKYKDEFEIITVENGEEAIEILKKESISLLVTDLKMPKLNGFHLLAYMNENHPEIPCVVITAYGTPKIKERLEQEVLHYIEKPFEPDDLARTIIPALKRDTPSSQKKVPSGSLKGISVATFLQLVEIEEKTCLLEVSSVNDEKGLFYFENGQLYDAVYKNFVGEEAALKKDFKTN